MKKWSVWNYIWFALHMLGNWLMCLEYATKPATAYTPEYQQLVWVYGISAALVTAIFLWLMIKRSRAAMIIVMVIQGIDAVAALIRGNIIGVISSIVSILILWAICRNRVE